MKILDLPTNEKDTVTFFQDKGILLKRQICGSGHKAKLYFRKQHFWKCSIKYYQKRSTFVLVIRFVGSDISFVHTLCFIYYW